jgi:hypothetical protein
MSLRNARFALDDDARADGDAAPWTWSVRESLKDGVWPRLESMDNGHISLREVCERFSRPGAELREMAGESRDVWEDITRAAVVHGLRHRLRNPASMRQGETDFCGPLSILTVFARRNPVLFIRGAAELLRVGVFTTRTGKQFVADEELRSRPVPLGGISALEWIYAATMRDSENTIDDVETGNDFLEGTTWPFEIEEWTEDVLGLRAEYIPCWSDGELSALRAGQRALERGGVAFLLVDKNLLHDGDVDDEGNPESDPEREENMWWRRKRYHGSGAVGEYPDHWKHSEDDAIPPDHWVVLRGGLRGASEGSEDFRVVVWSFGCDYEFKGSADSFGEYLYGVITGVPDD